MDLKFYVHLKFHILKFHKKYDEVRERFRAHHKYKFEQYPIISSGYGSTEAGTLVFECGHFRKVYSSDNFRLNLWFYWLKDLKLVVAKHFEALPRNNELQLAEKLLTRISKSKLSTSMAKNCLRAKSVKLL